MKSKFKVLIRNIVNAINIKKLSRKGLSLIIFIILCVWLIICELIVSSQSSFHDFFSEEKLAEFNNKPTNITKNIVVDTLSINKSGGIKNITENIVNGVAEKHSDWFFTVLCAVDLERPFCFNHENIKVIPVKFACSNLLLYIRNILDYCSFGIFHDQITQLICYDKIIFNKNSCDLIFDPYAEFNINDYYDIPKVSLIHDILYIDMPSCFEEKGLTWRIDNAPRMVKSSNKIITISDFTRQRVMDAYELSPKFVKSIPTKLATRVRSYNSSKETEQRVLQEFSLTSKDYLIYISVIRQHKNYKGLLYAFIKYVQQHPETTLKLVTVGTVKPELVDQAYELIAQQSKNKQQYEQIRKKVIFTQFVSDEELQILLSNSMAMVFPSFYEGFGMPVIEAMSAGIPVTCSNTSSLPEVAGDAALFFDPYNIDDIERAIERISNDAQLREDLIQKGYKRAEYFSDTDSMIDEYIQTFEECME